MMGPAMPKIKDLIKAGKDQASLKTKDQEERDRRDINAMLRFSANLWGKVAERWQADGLVSHRGSQEAHIITASQRARKKSRRRMQRESRRRNRG